MLPSNTKEVTANKRAHGVCGRIAQCGPAPNLMGRHQPARQTTGAWTGEQNGYNLVGYHARDMAQSTSQHECAYSIMRRCS